jgi:nucleotide sugar dehydrogenase
MKIGDVGVVGLGIVGNAFYEGMLHAFRVVRYDKFRQDRSDVADIKTLCAEVGPIFVCVPTPMGSDGTCNTGIVEDVLSEIEGAGDNRVVVIKSTILPGTTDRLNEMFPGLSVVFNPEFLTEVNSVEDFKNQDRIVIGGDHDSVAEIADLYHRAYPAATKVHCSAKCAEMVKYVANCFLATKVSFANEIYQICQGLGIDYNMVVRTATLDKRLGSSHWRVPGPDGHFGFGLTCFPKDLNAMIKLAESLSVDPKVMRAVWKKNLEVRPERDWEQMKGRAVL